MIYYFSATGNSQHVATRIAEALGTQAQSIETASTEIRLAARSLPSVTITKRNPTGNTSIASITRNNNTGHF